MGDYVVATDLTRSYGGSTPAVDGLTFSIRRGELFALLGPNGAGKTTTIRLLTGLLAPTRGDAFVGGRDVRDTEAGPELRRGIGLLPEAPGLYESLSVRRNLELFGKLFGLTGSAANDRIRSLLDRFDLADRAESLAGTLSKGMKQKVAIARALLHDPEFLLLDEPTSGLDPESAKTVKDALIALRAEDRTVLLSTHRLEDADRLADRVAIMRRTLLTLDTPERIKERLKTTRLRVEFVGPDAAAEGKLRELPFVREVVRDRSGYWVDVQEIDRDTPELVAAMVRGGLRLRAVTPQLATLEEAYLAVMGRTGSPIVGSAPA